MDRDKLPGEAESGASALTPPEVDADPADRNIAEGLAILNRLRAGELLTSAGDVYMPAGYELYKTCFATNISIICGLSLEGEDRSRKKETALMIGLSGDRARYEQGKPCWTTLGVVYLPNLRAEEQELRAASILGTQQYVVGAGTQLYHSRLFGYAAREMLVGNLLLRHALYVDSTSILDLVANLDSFLPWNAHRWLSREQLSAKLERIVHEKFQKGEFDSALGERRHVPGPAAGAKAPGSPSGINRRRRQHKRK
jgi:hypothetical protein